MSGFMLEPVRLISRESVPGIRGAFHGNGTVVAVDTNFMVYLKVEGGITVYLTEIYALGASDAFIHLYIVFPVRIFYKNPLNGISGADLIFCSRGEFIVFRVKIPKTIPAIAADGIRLDAFYR